MTSSPWWELLQWGWMATSLMITLAVLVAAILALRKVGGMGAKLLLVGGLVEFAGWSSNLVSNYVQSIDTTMWWSFFELGLWSLGSVLVVAGLLLLVLRAAGMKERLATLEAVAAQGSGPIAHGGEAPGGGTPPLP